MKVENYSWEVKDAQFIVDILTKVVEQIGPTKVAQVITNNAWIWTQSQIHNNAKIYSHT